jgi:hypothetical protein
MEGWLSSFIPLDSAVMERRLDNWKTEWERKILMRMSKDKAKRRQQIESARAEAEAKIVLSFAKIAEEITPDNEASKTALALRFIDCLGEMISESDTQWPLPDDVEHTLKRLRGEIEGGPR